MARDIPFYYVTLDGEDPCTWAPFGTSLSEVENSTKKALIDSDFSNSKKFSVSILCRKHELVADEAISQCIGCLIAGEYLKPERKSYIEKQFHNFSNRLLSLNTKVLPALGFEIYIIAQDESSEETIKRAMEFKKRLVLVGISEQLLRIDIIRDQRRLAEVSKLRLLNIANMRAAATLPD